MAHDVHYNCLGSLWLLVVGDCEPATSAPTLLAMPRLYPKATNRFTVTNEVAPECKDYALSGSSVTGFKATGTGAQLTTELVDEMCYSFNGVVYLLQYEYDADGFIP